MITLDVYKYMLALCLYTQLYEVGLRKIIDYISYKLSTPPKDYTVLIYGIIYYM